jgi:hypothetical protein
MPSDWLRNFKEMGSAAPDRFTRENATLASIRKWLFYPGVYLNALTLAILIEWTGRLFHSPFTPLLFALILGGQQLSRFRVSSSLYISFGILLTLSMLAYESTQPASQAPEPPAGLAFALLATSFLFPAVIGHFEKGHNPRAGGTRPLPRVVDVSCNDHGVWNYCFYSSKGSRPINSIVEDIHGGDGLQSVKDFCNQRLRALCELEELPKPVLVWFDDATEAGAVGQITFPNARERDIHE